MVKIQLISDTHLEFGHNIEITPLGDVLVMAGDIGTMDSRYFSFVEECSKLFKHIVVVTGNHEYWTKKGCKYVDSKIRNFAKNIENVHFLQNDHVDIEGIRFLGCTMWTKIPKEYAHIIEKTSNDYKYILKKTNGIKRKIKVENVQEWHFHHRIWLRKSIDESPLPVVIVTHHSPIYETFPKPMDYAYHCNMVDLMGGPVLLWCHGHTHQYRKIGVDTTIVWSNPKGRPGEDTKYNPSDVVELKIY